ncbi:MAG: hypothetical protein Q9226_005982 [Calogaya cf. arnoldii]
MVSRSDKAPSKPLAVAGRCKPMKVEKPKKPRTHKVKQGTPPKLSASQKRKLVRIYVFTNLSWKEISTLVLHYGRKDIKKRALQYTLQNLLSDQYNQMRPKDTSARRKRALQIKRHLELRRFKSKPKTFEATPQPAKTHLPRTTGSLAGDHGEPYFGTQIEPFNNIESVEGDQSYINEFDKLIDTQGQEFPLLLEMLLETRRTTSPSSLPALFQGASGSLPPESAPDGIFSHADVHHSDLELEPIGYHDPVQTDSTSLLETPSENHLFELEGDLNWPTDVSASNVAYEHEDVQETMDRLTKRDSQSLPYGSLDPALSAEPHKHISHSTDNAQAFRVSEYSTFSDLSVLVDRLPKCSLGEKSFIRDVLRQFSVSTLTSINSSDVPGVSVRLAEISRDRIPFKPARSLGGQRGLLPGDFITSHVNTFWDHVCCKTPPTSRWDGMTFCRGCCQEPMPGTYRRWCIPFAVIRAKRDLQVAEKYRDPRVTVIWCDEGDPWWVDRFGNTSLHIAAALGARWQELKDIIEKGAGIHVCNSAGQTFMHVLNPYPRESNDSLLDLTDFLRRNNFKFDHRDVLGHTFIDSLEHRGIQLAECWPTSIVYNLRRELYGDDRTAKVTPPWFHAWSEDLSYNCSTHLWELLKVPRTVLPRFKHFQDFQDFHGRNDLHTAVNKTEKPPEISEQSFNDSSLSIVKYLLSIGVEVDHHDNQGETPLMTHIRTLPSQDDIILELLHSGADINARNEEGETALHISIKLGDIIGTKALLAQRATVNLHVRNWFGFGEGLLTVAAAAQRRAKDDVGLYAKITTCMALAIDSGAIIQPTLFDEWNLREPAREVLRKAGYIVAPKDEDPT